MTITTKYSLDDTVWLMHKNRATTRKVISVTVFQHVNVERADVGIKYGLIDLENVFESELFASKDELLSAL